MSIYVDSSALVKRVSKEQHQAAVSAALAEAVLDGRPLITSALARVEVSRALRVRIEDHDPRVVKAASDRALEGVGIAPISGPVLESARIIGPPVLRSLDAIHLATAIAVGAEEVWTYDDRLAEASEEMGILARKPS